MAEVKLIHDRDGQTLTVWFSDPSDEFVCEETGHQIVLIKDRSGHVIGVEKPSVDTQPAIDGHLKAGHHT